MPVHFDRMQTRRRASEPWEQMLYSNQALIDRSEGSAFWSAQVWIVQSLEKRWEGWSLAKLPAFPSGPAYWGILGVVIPKKGIVPKLWS